jgi:hypothetical protein
MTETMIDVKPISTKTVDELSKEVTTLTAKTVVVKNQTDYNLASEVLKSIKGLAKRLEEERKKITSPLDAAKKAVQSLFVPQQDKLDVAERTIKNAMIAFADEQECIRREEERKLQEKAEKDRQAALKKADEARAKGNEAKAASLEEKAANVVAPVLAPRAETPAGAAFVTRWTAEVLDFSLLPDEYKIVDQKKLDMVARALKESFNVPGATAKVTKVLSQRI